MLAENSIFVTHQKAIITVWNIAHLAFLNNFIDMHFYVSLQHHKTGLPVGYQGAVRVPQGYSLQDCRRIKVMIGVLMLDATGEADGCNHQISEQRWLVMPHGIQLVIRNKSLRKTGFLIIPPSPRTETKHLCHLFMEMLFIENIYIQKR